MEPRDRKPDRRDDGPPRKKKFFAPRDPDAPRGSRGGDQGHGGPSKRPKLGIFTTTLWEYPSQHYTSERPLSPEEVREGRTRFMQGDKNYVGATPSWVVWQLLKRYTKEGETVLDPMCGSGTTLDVCRDVDRKGVGFDLAPTRSEIQQADARHLPLRSASVDFAFIDPPYSTHVDYSDDARCIGKLDAAGEDGGIAYYTAMERVFSEIHRVLRPGRHMALYVSDSWRKKRGGDPGEGTFMPIGFELFARLRQRFTPCDIVCVVRHNEKLSRGNWHKAAEAENFFLRGFNYLIIMRKGASERSGRDGPGR